MSVTVLDIFAGGGGLSEGFERAGGELIAHIEKDAAACFTLRTRCAYRWLLKNNKIDIYKKYINGKIDRSKFYSYVPNEEFEKVIESEVCESNLSGIFDEVKRRLMGRNLDIVIGGPPCQAYSLIGRARDKNNMRGDPRNYLYEMYCRFLKEFKPKYFVFENVNGILSAKDGDGKLFFHKMLVLFEKCGYSVEYELINARDYGVLQNRNRLIIIGKFGKDVGFFPKLEKVEQKYFVWDVFSDLPKIKAGGGRYECQKLIGMGSSYLYNYKIRTKDEDGVSWHKSRNNSVNDLKIYKKVVKLWNDKQERLNYSDLPKKMQTQNNLINFLDRYKVVAGNLKYSQTVVAHLAKDGHYFIHPDIRQNRSITPREAARLQTFPDDYYFESVSGVPSKTAAYKQIGNAVPVVLAEKIAIAILQKFDR